MSLEQAFEYVQARRILLTALEALGTHRKAVVLVGAQAIYLRVGAGGLLVAPFTSDGDLALNPTVLDDEPLLADALSTAGFSLAITPGTWVQSDVQIDLMVPTTLAPEGRRGARLGRHGKEVARKANGLEAAMVDNNVFTLTALDPGDARKVEVAVAGLGALLVGKLHKLAERRDTPARWEPKDGLDVLRILQAAHVQKLAATLVELERNSISESVTREACVYLEQLFAVQGGHGAAMAVRATIGVENAATIYGSCQALAGELLAARNIALERRDGHK